MISFLLNIGQCLLAGNFLTKERQSNSVTFVYAEFSDGYNVVVCKFTEINLI